MSPIPIAAGMLIETWVTGSMHQTGRHTPGAAVVPAELGDAPRFLWYHEFSNRRLKRSAQVLWWVALIVAVVLIVFTN
jgi:hypothetical protein